MRFLNEVLDTSPESDPVDVDPLASDLPTCAEPPPKSVADMEWWKWVAIVVLIILSGCFSGLNLGVLGLDLKDLELMT